MALPEPTRELPILAGVPVLAAGDVDATAAYYRDRLGFRVTVVWPGRWVRLHRGEVEIQLEQSDAIRRIGPFEKGGVAFRVDDVDAWCAELQRRGAEFDQGPTDQGYGWQDLSVVDPNGYRLVFWQPRRAGGPVGPPPAELDPVADWLWEVVAAAGQDREKLRPLLHAMTADRLEAFCRQLMCAAAELYPTHEIPERDLWEGDLLAAAH